MSLSSIIGQPLAVDLARQWLKREANQPLLFHGPEGTGKRTLALEMAKALNCTNKRADSCDACNSCRKITAGNHPDVRVVNLEYQAVEREEAVAKQQTLRIETILEERRRLLQSAVEGSWKVTIIDEAHRLTADAANVLLKILEEPPPRTALFLLTAFRDRLFATLLSRCQPVRFRPLNDDEMRQVLTRLSGSDPNGDMGSDPRFARLIELALGSPGRALHMSRDEQIEGIREAEALWQSLPGESPASIGARGDPSMKSARPTRAEIEERVRRLLVPATQTLRSGDAAAAAPIRLMEEALIKLRQNVQPGLVYDYLLMQLTQQRK